jgi:predicted nucleic acid-binding protein
MYPLKPPSLLSPTPRLSIVTGSGPTWTPYSTKTRARVVEQRHRRGLIDTSVVIDLDRLDVETLPRQLAVSAVTFAELSAGPHATNDAAERARRQERLQRAEATFDPLPVDGGVARAYGRVYAEVMAGGRKARGRAFDLLIAATAVAAELPLYTCNPDDFQGLSNLLEVVHTKPSLS